MCPLGKECPDYIGYRWPVTEIPTIVPLGATCVFAHTHNELRFKQELKSRENMIKEQIKKFNYMGQQKDENKKN